MQNLISTSRTSGIAQNLSGGNPNTAVHKMAMKSVSPSSQNNARAVFGPGALVFLTREAFLRLPKEHHSLGTYLNFTEYK